MLKSVGIHYEMFAALETIEVLNAELRWDTLDVTRRLEVDGVGQARRAGDATDELSNHRIAETAEGPSALPHSQSYARCSLRR